MEKKNVVKTVLQLALGLVCGYLLLLAFNAYLDRPVGTQSDGKTPILETIVTY